MNPDSVDRLSRRLAARLGRPLFDRLERALDPVETFRRLREGAPGAVLLESARVSPAHGRYSFVVTRPFLTLRAGADGWHARGLSGSWSGTSNPLGILERLLRACGRPAAPPEMPFAGGVVGYLGYESGRWIEPRIFRRAEAGDWPDICLFFADEGVVIDHLKQRTWLFAYRGSAGTDAGARSRLRRLSRRLDGRLRVTRPVTAAPVPAEVASSLPRPAFTEAVRRIKSHIRAGDIFQANLAQRISFPFEADAWGVYERLRRLNPSSFFGYLESGDLRIVCGSPERLVRLDGSSLETRPIAGTRPRGRSAEEDARLGRRLLLSPKERAEHVMLVDLERNDLGRVAEYGSVSVDELCAVEEYSHVRHIVSNVRARLRAGAGPVDALRALFPGGTITGTPKIRSIEILAGIEPVARGPYTGSLGYIGFSGAMDFNIIIRSLLVARRTAHVYAGAGIVADSSPEREHDETLHKAEAVLVAALGAGGARRALRRLRSAAGGA